MIWTLLVTSLIIVCLLRYLNIFDMQSVFIYLMGVLFIFYNFSLENSPYLILFFFGISYIFYVLFISLKENRHKLSNISFDIVRSYINLFFIGFIFSFIFSPLNFISKNFFIMFFSIFLFQLFFKWLTSKLIFKQKVFKYLNYRLFFIILIFQLFLSEQFTLIWNSFYIGILYVFMHLVYYSVFYGFTKELLISELKPRMLLAEQIIKIGKVYKKNSTFYLSPQIYFRSKLMQIVTKHEIVINTTKPLSLGDIVMIKGRMLVSIGILFMLFPVVFFGCSGGEGYTYKGDNNE